MDIIIAKEVGERIHRSKSTVLWRAKKRGIEGYKYNLSEGIRFFTEFQYAVIKMDHSQFMSLIRENPNHQKEVIFESKMNFENFE